MLINSLNFYYYFQIIICKNAIKMISESTPELRVTFREFKNYLH